ncbi:calcium-binding protein [Yoonia sp. R2331]|uniref:calcium-binding protein n=1 Tax=Yoonia sp. R2331 TaxID=3237238 RepID=UPI0034E3D90D
MTLIKTDSVAFTDPIKDIHIAQVGGNFFVYAQSSDPLAGIQVMRLTKTGDIRPPVAVLEQGEAVDGSYFTLFDDGPGPGLASINVDGTRYVVAGGQYDVSGGVADNRGVHVFQTSSDGTLAPIRFFDRGDTITSLVQTIDLRNFTQRIPHIYEVIDQGGDASDIVVVNWVVNLDDIRQKSYQLPSRAVEDVFLIADVYEHPAMFFLDDETNGIHWVTFSLGGTAQYTDVIPGSGVSDAKAPNDIAVVSMPNIEFLITASEKGGINSYHLEASSSRLRDEVLNRSQLKATLDSRNGDANWASDTIATFTIDDRGYVVSAGEKLTVFEISREGTLWGMSRKGLGDVDVTDIEVTVRQGNAVIVVSSDAGVDSFVFTPGVPQNQYGTEENETLLGDGRSNRISGDKGGDVIRGYAGADQLWGGNSDDDLYGGQGRDKLYGGYHDDELFGGRENDHLYGGPGHDNIYDGKGSDMLFGGTGRDIFHLSRDHRVDTIRKWDGSDRINLERFKKIESFDDIEVRQRPDGKLNVFIQDEILVLASARRLTLDDISEWHFQFYDGA